MASTPASTMPALTSTLLRRILLFFISIIIIWFVVGYLATIPVAGDHPYWRRERIYQHL